MKSFILLFLFGSICITQGIAQVLGNPVQNVLNGAQDAVKGAPVPVSAKNPEQDWANVVNLTTTIGQVGQATLGQAKTLVQIDADKVQKATAAVQVSLAAKDFYTNNPDNVNAPAAKKLEALSVVQGAVKADSVQKQTALQVAQNFRSDAHNAAADRFDVAAEMERLKLSDKLGGELYAYNPAEMEKLAETLQVEFGDLPEAYYFYASVARTSDMATAARMATNLLQRPAPPTAKADAQAILDRQKLIGTMLSFKLTAVDGSTIDLAQLSGRVTLLFAWSANSPTSLGLLSSAKKLLPADAQIIYFCPAATSQQVLAAKSRAKIPGIFCYEASAEAGSAADSLKLQLLPYVFALDKTGKVAACGPIDTLPALIAAAAGLASTNL